MSAVCRMLADPTFQTVVAGAALLGVVSGVLSCFAVLRGQSLLGDGVSHAALPGIVAAFLLTGSKSTEALLLGALASGVLAVLLIVTTARASRIKFGTALAVVMSSLFGLGLVLLTHAQKLPDANQAGLTRFLFGQASALLARDIRVIGICGAVILALTALLWKELKLVSFDREYASVAGFPMRGIEALLSLMLVAGIVTGLQTVGVVLMSAMLTAPAVAARQWCRRLEGMAALSAVFGALSGAAGTAASSLVPGLPTGPAIVVAASALVFLSVLLVPGRGILARMHRKRRGERAAGSEGSDADVAAG